MVTSEQQVVKQLTPGWHLNLKSRLEIQFFGLAGLFGRLIHFSGLSDGPVESRRRVVTLKSKPVPYGGKSVNGMPEPCKCLNLER